MTPLILALFLAHSPAARAGESPEQLLARAKALEKASHHSDAEALARTAAEKGSAEAWYWLGMNTLGDTQSYFVKSAELGYAKAFSYALDATLFRAEKKADVAEAKKLGDLAREKGIKLGYDSGAQLRTIDRCFEAGEPKLPADAPADADWNLLAEKYANGDGVPRDVRNAIALVCHASGVPAELEGLVDALYAEKDAPKPSREFRFCDYVTSGENGGVCAAREEETAARKRADSLTALSASWTPEQKRKLESLLAYAETFFKEHASSEMDQSGTARTQQDIQEESIARDALLSELRSFERGKLPGERELKQVNKELERVLARIGAREKVQRYGTVTRAGVKKTQEKWAAYRDAWLALGAARWPKIPPDQWRAWLMSKRVNQLRKLSPEPE